MRLFTFVIFVSLGFFSAGALGQQVFTANLNSAQEVPPITSTATGFGRVTLNAEETQITASVYYTGLTSPGTTVGHIHSASAGIIGPVSFNLVPPTGQTSGSVVGATYSVTAAQVAALKSGGMYFNIHTTSNPGGEIRGQIGSSAEFVATLTGRQENPAVNSTGSGRASVSLNALGDQALVTVQWRDLSGPVTVGHVHTGAFGSNGAVVCNLSPPTVVSGSVVDFLCNFSFAQIGVLRRGGFYVNLHTSANPGGEIRGQILPRPALVARLNSAQQVPANAGIGKGLGFIQINDASGDAFVNLTWTGLSGPATSGHLHFGEIGVNGAVVCDLAPIAAAAGEVTDARCVLSPGQITALKNGLGYFDIHTTANPGGEIRGQINASLRDGFEDQNDFVPFSSDQLIPSGLKAAQSALMQNSAAQATSCHGGDH
jgi:hypothetical protein